MFSVTNLIIIALFWVAELVAFPLFIKAQWPKACYKSFVLKMVSASIFLGYGIFLACVVGWDSKFTLYMVIGLAGGWLGDMLLHLSPFMSEDNKVGDAIAFVLGLLAFLAGHIMYVLAYIDAINKFDIKITWVTYALIAVVVVACIIVKFAAKVKLGIAVVPVLLYCITISTMLAMACTLGVGLFSTSAITAIALILGAILFVVSDGTLVFNMFGSEGAKTSYPLKVVNLTTYFIAQMLLASAIILIANIA